ncbi:MAG: hypothetical protein R6X22_04245 [Gemmatimonadota bacterium]
MTRAGGPIDTPASPGAASVLLVTAHDWFASSMTAVLRPENFAVVRVHTAREAIRDVVALKPSLVVIDEELVELTPEVLIRSFRTAGLAESAPIVVYSPSFWREGAQASFVQAGAWDVIREPIRPHLLVSKLRRLLQIREMIERVEKDSLADAATGLFNLAGLVRLLRVLGSAAERSGSELSCAVIGLGDSDADAMEDGIRRQVAELFQRNLRRSDACGWLSGSELGVLAYGASPAGVTTLVRRIEEQARTSPVSDALAPIRVGIAQLSIGAGGPRGPSEELSGEAAGLARLASARQALYAATSDGGGIRIADPTD